MAQGIGSIRDLIVQRERDFLMGKGRVKMRSSLVNIEVGDFRIEELKAGETAEMPRWVAEDLEALDLAEMEEEPFETEIYRAMSKEKLMGPLQLSGLPQDFYLRMKSRLRHLTAAVAEGKFRKADLDKLRAVSYDLVGMRLSKLLSLSSSATSATALAEKLTPEENAYFGVSQSLSKEWRSAILGESA